METPARHRDDGPIRSTLVAIGLTVFGLIGAAIATVPAILVDPALGRSLAAASIEGRTTYMVLNFVGMALAGGLYLAATGRGWSYVDIRLPSKRGWGYVLAGFVGTLAFYVLVNVLVQVLSLPTAESEVIRVIDNDQTMVLIMILIVFFFNAPAEEFLFRNVVQKRLYDAFGRLQSVLIASGIFALVHFPMYVLLADSMLATASSLSIIFGGSLIFGYLYAKTGNLVVPIVAHATLNAVQFALLYVALEYDDLEAAEPSTSLLVDLLAVVPL